MFDFKRIRPGIYEVVRSNLGIAVVAAVAALCTGLGAVLGLDSVDEVGAASPARPATITSFQGPVAEGGQVPDAQIAAGPDGLLVATNQGIALMDKEGEVLAEADLTRFFSPAFSKNQGAGDPRVLYDAGSERFFMVALGGAIRFVPNCVAGETCLSNFLLAVSTTSTPETFTEDDWYLWELDATLDVTSQGRRRSTNWLDFTSIAVGRKVVVLTGHMLDEDGGGNHYAKIRVVPKRKVVRGKKLKPRRWSDYVRFKPPDDPDGRDVLVIQPVRHLDDAGRVFLVTSGTCSITVWGLKDKRRPGPLRGVTWTPPGPQPEAYPCGDNPDAPQKGSHLAVDTQTQGGVTERPLFRDDGLWVAMARERKYGSGSVTGLWMLQFDVEDWPRSVSLLQEPVWESPDAFRSFPAIAVNADGNVVVVHAEFAADIHPSIRYLWQAAGNAGSLTDGGLLKAGEAPIVEQATWDPSFSRYGDYFGAAVDPVDGTFWVIGEYPIEGKWATWIAQLEVL